MARRNARQQMTTKQQDQQRNIAIAKQSIERDSVPFSAGYRAIPHVWFQQPRDLPPFSFMVIRSMLIDPEIRLNLSLRAAPIAKTQFGWKEGEQFQEGVQCQQPEIGQFIYRQLKRIWNEYLPCLLRSQVWGWSAGEVTVKLSEDGLVEIKSLEPRHASDCKIVKQGNKRWGVAIARVNDTGTIQLPFPYSFFHAYNAEDGDDYGVSCLLGAYSPWADKWFNGGALDVRRLFMHKDAYGGCDLGYPEGETMVNGQWVPNNMIARQIVEQLESGGVTTRPSTRDENGNEKWPLQRATVTANPAHILQYPQDLDVEIRRGMEIPDDVNQADGSGAWAGKRVGMASFYSSLDHWVVQIVRDLKEQILDPLVLLNFGVLPEYSIEHKPLAEQAMEQQSNAGPGPGGDPNAAQDPMGMQQGGQPAMPGLPAPQPGYPDPNAQAYDPNQQQPTMMSLTRGEIPLSDLIQSARRIARENIQSNRVQRLSVDASGHEHKSKGPGGGQFVSKGGGGGVAIDQPKKKAKSKQQKAATQGIEEGLRGIAQRSVNADNDMKDNFKRIAGLSDDQAQAALDTFKKYKLLKHDRVMGKHNVVHGAYLERGPIRRAAGLPDEDSTAQQAQSDVPNTAVEEEPVTPPPPGKAFYVDVEHTGDDGVSLTARVGVPGRDVPPPPPIPRLPNLTPAERRAESDFIQAFQDDPQGMAHKYRALIAKTAKPYTFETDQAKLLSDDWVDEDPDKQMKKRHLYNNALHQTANAVVKLAFLHHLDTLKPGDNVLVTVGGCGSGKGYTLKNTELGKNLTAQAKAVWDSAGDQNATENPWILEEAKKRGLNVTYAYVSGDPKVAWADPNRGVVKRAHDNSDGRMVDAAVFADSYVLGAKNHHAFHQANKNDPNAKFLFFSAKDQSQLDGVPQESLNLDRKSLYHWALGSIESRTDVAPTVMRGAVNGARIWNQEFFGSGVDAK